jgi:hypothetical protein
MMFYIFPKIKLKLNLTRHLSEAPLPYNPNPLPLCLQIPSLTPLLAPPPLCSLHRDRRPPRPTSPSVGPLRKFLRSFVPLFFGVLDLLDLLMLDLLCCS